MVLTFKPQSVKNTETAAYVAYLLLVLAIVAGVLLEIKRQKKEGEIKKSEPSKQ